MIVLQNKRKNTNQHTDDISDDLVERAQEYDRYMNHIGDGQMSSRTRRASLPRSYTSSCSRSEPWSCYNDWQDLQLLKKLGRGITQLLERRTRDWKVKGSNPCGSGWRIFFSRVDCLCWRVFRYLLHPRVTAVAHKRSRSFCQKCTC